MSKLAAGAFAALIIVSAAGPAVCADREFCRDYAQAALRQVRAGIRHERCVTHMDDVARWSPEFRNHFQWCLHVSKDTASDQREARHRVLAMCAH